MSRLYVFADEAGDFAFLKNGKASKYFIVCTITTHSCASGPALLDLRRELAWKKVPMGHHFHATTDSIQVRDAVYEAISQHDFQIQATIMEKTKAQLHVRSSNDRFYKYGWFYHFTYGMRSFRANNEEFLITAASVGTKKGQAVFTEAVQDVIGQTITRAQWSTAFWQAQCDPCLQVADYCTWAIQRKWERGDTKYYNLIKERITYEYDLWFRGTTHHY